MRAAFPAMIAISILLAGCSPPTQPETQAPQWGRGSNAKTAPPPPAAVPPTMPTMSIDTKADGQPYGSATARPTDQTTPDQRAEMEKAAAAAGLPVTPQTRTSFACDNGETVEVRFFPDQGVAVLVRGGQNTELQSEPVASGFKYSNGQTTIAGKGDEIKLNVGMMATATCKAAG
ncbi:MAG: MliC family protein [Sandaracinobacter sp.]